VTTMSLIQDLRKAKGLSRKELAEGEDSVRVSDDGMLIMANMMYEECQKRSCPDCSFFIKDRKDKCLFSGKPVVWDDLPESPRRWQLILKEVKIYDED